MPLSRGGDRGWRRVSGWRIAGSVPCENETVDWTIPATQTPATTYTVRIRSVSYANCFDFSNRAFTITR